MKKHLSAMLAAVLCLMSLSGCGGVDKSKKKPTADSDDVTITVWSGEGGAQAVWEEMVDEWNTTVGDEKDIFISWETVMDSTQVDVAFQNGQLPEIVGAGSANQHMKFAKEGALASIDELPGGEEFLKEYNDPGVEGFSMLDGKQYSVSKKALTAALAYNKDLFKQAGIVDKNGEAKPPKTIAELREAAKKITALGNGIYGFAFPLKFGLGYTIDTLTYSSFSLDNPMVDTNLDTLTVTYPSYQARYQWILDMKEDGSLFPGAETLDNDTARAYFSAGTVGMIPAISWDVGVYTTQYPAECDWDICEFPILDGHMPWLNYTSITSGLTVSKNAIKDEKTAKATMEVYKFIHSVDTRATLFERGIDLSSKKDVLEVADYDKIDPHFAKFAELVEEDYKRYPTETYTIEGDNFGTLFQKVWIGEISLESAIKDMEKRATEGLRKAVKNGTYDVERQKEIMAEQRADFEKIKAKRAVK